MLYIRQLNINRDWTLFLDRDGVINKKAAEHDYVKSVGEFEFLPGALVALAGLSNIFGKIIIITNQRGIGRGLMSNQDLLDIHEHMNQAVAGAGGRIDAIYFCPHDYQYHCDCRKPGSGLYYQAQKDFPDIDFKKSIKVGDSLTDILSARPLGIKTVYLDYAASWDDTNGEVDFSFSSLNDFYQSLLKYVP